MNFMEVHSSDVNDLLGNENPMTHICLSLNPEYLRGGLRSISSMPGNVQVDHEMTEETPSVDRYGFAAGGPFGWTKGQHRCVPEGGLTAEYKRVRNGNGDFINRPGELGSNLAGTKRLIVPPMGPGEELVCIPPRACLTQRAAMISAAKELSNKLGHHNVGLLRAWIGESGKVRESIATALVKESPDIFCDNVVLGVRLSAAEKQANTASQQIGLCRSKIVRFLRAMKFTVSHALDEGQGYVGEEQDTRNNFFLKLLPNNLWKLSIADLSLEDISFLLNVLRNAAEFTGPDELDRPAHASRMLNWATTQVANRKRFKMTAMDLLSALILATSIEFSDIDLTVDVPGTLNCDQYIAEMAAKFGLDAKQTSKTGLNCVSMKEFEQDGICLRMKAYNKVFETIQQGSLRGEGIDCKIGYLLNPSTERMTREFHNPEFHENGITRFEITFKLAGPHNAAGKANIPHLKAMAKLLRKFPSALGLTTLVQCSIQESLEAHERCMGRTIGIYFAAVSREKQQLIEQEMGKTSMSTNEGLKLIKTMLNNIPDGLIIRFRNSKTRKFNGFELKSKLFSKTKTLNGWDAFKHGLAWGSSCGEPPLLLIQVDQGAPQNKLTCMYFRAVQVAITGAEQLMNLTWSGDFKKGNFRNKCTDLGKIGVRPDSLNKLKLAVLDKETKPSFHSMGRVDLEIGMDCDDLIKASVADSEELASATGYGRIIHALQDHQGLLSDWASCSRYKIDSVGRLGTKKLMFEVKGVRFWAPRRQSVEMIKKVDKKDTDGQQPIISVKMIEQEFFWKIDGRVFGKCQAAKAIPVVESAIAVQGGGEERTGKAKTLYVHIEAGRYFLPRSIRDQLTVKWGPEQMERSLDINLASVTIIHNKGASGRVSGYANAEEYLTIQDQTGCIIASNLPSEGNKRRKLA